MIKGTKNHLVFGIIKKIFVFIFKFIYIFVKFLNLQPAVLVGLVGLILYLTGKLDGTGGALSTIFYILLILSLFYSIIKTIQSILFPNREKKRKNDRKVGIVDNKDQTEENVNDTVKTVTKETVGTPNVTTTKTVQEEVKEKVKPIYYAVKQNPDYLMAEYPDRYELYLKTDKGLVKIRTDLKS